MNVRYVLAAALTFVASFFARAVPPDKVIELKEGEEVFLPAGLGTWQAISENPLTVEARGVEGGEIHLKARGRGQALVLVENRKVGRAYIWSVLVEEQVPAKPVVSSLPCSCTRPDPEEPPVCVIDNRKCLIELRRTLAGSGATNEDLWVRYRLEGLQSLLSQMEEKLSRMGFTDVKPIFAGGNLRLEGWVRDEQERNRLIFELYRLMVGRMVLEDRLKIGQNKSVSSPTE